MKSMKKVMAFLLSVVMTLTMCTVAFAAGNTTLTIKTTAGHTYKVYQLLAGDVSGLTGGSGTLANVTVGRSVNNGATADQIVKTLNEIEEEINNPEMNVTEGDLGNAAYAYVKGAGAYKTITGDGTEQEVAVEQGYYVVTDERSEGSNTTDSLSRYLVAVAGPTTMEPKTETPDIDKKIIDTDKNAAIDGDYKKTDTAAIGDVINYEISGEVPNHIGYTYYYYVLEDTLDKGLTLNEDSFEVEIADVPYPKEDGRIVVDGVMKEDGTHDGNTSPIYYLYITHNSDGTTSFKLSIDNITGYTVGSSISVKYNATVNENATIGAVANKNTVKLIFSNNPNQSGRGDKNNEPGIPDSTVPTGNTPDRVTKTYVTELKVLKVDGEDNKLTGAEFTLTGTNLTKIKFTTGDSYVKADDGTFWKLKDGTYTTDDPNKEGMDQTKYEDVNTKYKKETIVTAQTAAESNKSVTAFVDSKGYIQFTGLNAGDYTLTETVTPTGYNTIKPINFKISAEQENASVAVGGDIKWSSNNDNITLKNGTFEIKVVNQKGIVLPSTGGMGTTIFYIVGCVLVIGAGALLIAKKRRNS